MNNIIYMAGMDFSIICVILYFLWISIHHEVIIMFIIFFGCWYTRKDMNDWERALKEFLSIARLLPSNKITFNSFLQFLYWLSLKYKSFVLLKYFAKYEVQKSAFVISTRGWRVMPGIEYVCVLSQPVK